MSKEVDLQKIELKVSVNCCDGCKKKVKKILQSIEGVYKTEIDPSRPKVIVVGNVEPQTLIRKLLKAGKQAQIWSNENQNAGKEIKEIQVVITREQDTEQSKSVCKQAKCSDTSTTATDKIKESTDGGEGSSNKSSTDQKKDTNCIAKTSSSPEITTQEKTLPPQPEVPCIIYPSMLHNKGKVRTDTQYYCYMVEPCTTALPSYYAIHPYQAPPLSPCCSQEHYTGPVSQPSVQTPAAKVGDYFSDENTTGCHVM